jgi:hypothetical protein
VVDATGASPCDFRSASPNLRRAMHTTDAHWSKPRHPCGRFYPHGHPPERLNDEITADYNDMIYAATREEIEARRKAFIRK